MVIINIRNKGSWYEWTIRCILLNSAACFYVFFFFLQVSTISSGNMETQGDRVTHPGQRPFTYASASWHLGMI